MRSDDGTFSCAVAYADNDRLSISLSNALERSNDAPLMTRLPINVVAVDQIRGTMDHFLTRGLLLIDYGLLAAADSR